jgi:predicted DNA-binding transcriptional regulator AlpA
MSGQTETSPYLTVDETALMLRVNRRTLHRHRAAGIGPRWSRIGLRLIRYDRQDVLELVAHHERKDRGHVDHQAARQPSEIRRTHPGS